MAHKSPAFFTLLFTLSTLGACGPCVDSNRTPVPGPGGGSVIVAADMCDGDGSGGASSGSGSSGSTGGSPTDTTEDGGASETSASSGGEECPIITCEDGETCPGGTFCQAGECVMTCPCQADPGPCASKPFGGPVWFCPPDAAPTCG